MRSVEMKNRCLLYYGNPVGYRTEQGVVADSMFRREELEDWLARKGLAVRWEDGIYDRLSSGGYQKAADNGPALKSCRMFMEKLYKKYVPSQTREYIESMAEPEEQPRPRPARSPRSAAPDTFDEKKGVE